MAKPIIPSATTYVTAAIDAIVAARPSTLTHFNNPNSNYNRLPPMWRAQALLLLSWLSDSVQSARLKFSKGDALRSLAQSEFRTQLPSNPQTALGSLQMTRTGTASGIVPAGTLFTKKANTSAIPLPIAAATYITSAPVYVQENQQNVTFNFTAQSPGVAGNLTLFGGYANGGLIQPSQPLFDTTFVTNNRSEPLLANAAGGSSGLQDPVLVAASKAYIIGQFGPTIGAAIAGLLAQQSVRHYAVFNATDASPRATIFIADESWADSQQWHNQVAQAIANRWQGFGVRPTFGSVINNQISIAANFILNSTDYLNYTDDIDVNVRTTAESYFNDRPDWYRFRVGSLQQMLTKADPRIRKCTGVTIYNALTGDELVEPPNNYPPLDLLLVHYYLTDQGVSTSYEPPN